MKTDFVIQQRWLYGRAEMMDAGVPIYEVFDMNDPSDDGRFFDSFYEAEKYATITEKEYVDSLKSKEVG